MNFDEIKALLALASARDGRKPSQVMALAWLEDLGDLDFDTARAALGRHCRESSDYLMPVHIRRLAVEVRRDREREARKTAPTGVLALPSRFEPASDAVVAAFERSAATRAELRAALIAAQERRREATDPYRRAEAALAALDRAIADMTPVDEEAVAAP